jgi:hypothetical protein
LEISHSDVPDDQDLRHGLPADDSRLKAPEAPRNEPVVWVGWRNVNLVVASGTSKRCRALGANRLDQFARIIFLFQSHKCSQFYPEWHAIFRTISGVRKRTAVNRRATGKRIHGLHEQI